MKKNEALVRIFNGTISKIESIVTIIPLRGRRIDEPGQTVIIEDRIGLPLTPGLLNLKRNATVFCAVLCMLCFKGCHPFSF